MSDKLYEAAVFYNAHLNNKVYHLKASRKGVILEFNIVFRDENFKHLIGFHKLVDLPEYRKTSSTILESILTHQMDYDYISSSAYHSEIVDRIDNFKELINCLYTKELMLSRINEYSFNRIQADYLMTKETDFGIIAVFERKSS